LDSYVYYINDFWSRHGACGPLAHGSHLWLTFFSIMNLVFFLNRAGQSYLNWAEAYYLCK